MRPKLSQADISRLLDDPSEEARAEVAVKLGADVAGRELSGQERAIAADIMRLLARDAAERVRAALAQSLANARDVPPEVAGRIARDLDAIARPFLERSPALSDNDLIEIVREGSEEKACAIADRKGLPASVSGVIAAEAGRAAVSRLLGNATAEIASSGYVAMMGRWPGDDDIARGIAERPALSPLVAERLVSLVSEGVRELLLANPAVSGEVAGRLALEAREQATIGLLDGLAGVENLPRFVQQLHSSQRLTPTLIVRAACMGEMRFVEAALAHLAHISQERAWTLVHDAGRLGLRALFARAGLPEPLYLPLRIAVDAYHETALEGGEQERTAFRRIILERVLTQYDDVAADDVDFLLYELARQGETEAHPA